MEKEIIYREIHRGEEDKVCQMVEDCFNEFISPGYSQEGRNEFLKYLNPQSMQSRLAHNHFILVAVEGGVIAGVVEVRNCNHISLLFVKKEYHGRGIAKDLLKLALSKCQQIKSEINIIEVNSSPFAVHIYEKLGFTKVSTEQVVNGMRFTPMILKLR